MHARQCKKGRANSTAMPLAPLRTMFQDRCMNFDSCRTEAANLLQTETSIHATKRWQCYTTVQFWPYADLQRIHVNNAAAGCSNVKQWAGKVGLHDLPKGQQSRTIHSKAIDKIHVQVLFKAFQSRQGLQHHAGGSSRPQSSTTLLVATLVIPASETRAGPPQQKDEQGQRTVHEYLQRGWVLRIVQSERACASLHPCFDIE
mmetsp:Transcript_1571/g.2962  ORF Transcript_1571/g.2962 Transcript_1571/m.2962 type:complete len:202 (-) Transcript_1571:634-1239(-)